MQRISKRNRRALLILGTFLSVVILVFYIILPFYEVQAQVAGQIDQKRNELQRSLRVLAERDATFSRLTAVDGVIGEYRNMLLNAGDARSAIVQIEEVVRALADQNGVKVIRSNPLPDRKAGEGYAKIVLQFNLESDLPSLIEFLHAISRHNQFLAVEEFNLASFRVKDRTRIQPRMQIAGYISLS